MDEIIIKGARENNLKNIDVEMPLHAFTCVTGCSGCGKSSLVYDTIYAESQREFLEGMTGNVLGQKLLNKPKVKLIENLYPAINISQQYYNVNPRSTVGTVTEISYYLRTLFSLVCSDENNILTERDFSSNNPKVFCEHCCGVGIEKVISESLLVPDTNKKLNEGGILLFKGAEGGKEQKYLEALCAYYAIDISKRISDLTADELYKLLYSEDKIKYKLSYKEGRKKRQYTVYLQGAVPIIKERISWSKDTLSTTIYSKYMVERKCTVCNGSKFKKQVLEYVINGMNYYDIENMDLSNLYTWLKEYKSNLIEGPKKHIILELIDVMINKILVLSELNVDYLSLNRTIPTLSGGEKQRIRLASQLSCSLRGLMYILDEPCKGLHFKDVENIIKATKRLIDMGNTVIAIEHNKQYISTADKIIELGPVGGPDGGYVINTNKEKMEFKYVIEQKKQKQYNEYISLKKINFRNIKKQSVKIPIGGITCITGVSGSGKSSLTSVIIECVNRKTNVFCDEISGVNKIKRVVEVDQSPIGKTPRSTIVSYLNISSEIRTLLSKTDLAKKLKIGASAFSMNVKGGRCECCQGTGLKKIELNYLPSTYIICPDCDGKRFSDEILSVKYKGKNIRDILELPISEVIEIFLDSKKIYFVLNSMIELGLGYLKLGQMSMNLSGGEAQRIKLAKALGINSSSNNLYILDEPTSGLNDSDIKKLKKILLSLEEKHETIIMVEHNIELISVISDYIIDFGIRAGRYGGTVVAQGKPKEVFECEKSSLYYINKLQ